MTRENKLGMVVGFGLLLFVGILVSDHFSAAQRQETTRITRGDVVRDRGPREITLQPLPVAGVASVQGDSMPGQPADARAVSLNTPVDVQRDPVEPIAKASAGKAKGQESEPGVRLRPIGDGETLFSICKKEYGDGSLAQSLAAYNKKAVPDPTRIRKGVTIRLPPVEVLRPGAKGARAQGAAAAPEAVASNAAADVPALAVADVVAAESRAGAGGVITVDVAPGGMKGGKAADAKSSDAKASRKPTKKPSSKPKVS
jgi:predicted pyridoxine 5'-phosphate oxidase superfamily flavin-nucleotide-binding protein